MSNEVDDWFAERQHPLTDAMQRARKLILEADPWVTESIKVEDADVLLSARIGPYGKWSLTTSISAIILSSVTTFHRGIGYELALVLAHSSPLRDGDGAVRVDREEPVVAAGREA